MPGRNVVSDGRQRPGQETPAGRGRECTARDLARRRGGARRVPRLQPTPGRGELCLARCLRRSHGHRREPRRRRDLDLLGGSGARARGRRRCRRGPSGHRHNSRRRRHRLPELGLPGSRTGATGIPRLLSRRDRRRRHRPRTRAGRRMAGRTRLGPARTQPRSRRQRLQRAVPRAFLAGRTSRLGSARLRWPARHGRCGGDRRSALGGGRLRHDQGQRRTEAGMAPSRGNERRGAADRRGLRARRRCSRRGLPGEDPLPECGAGSRVAARHHDRNQRCLPARPGTRMRLRRTGRRLPCAPDLRCGPRL